jgi:hypothetical protein
MTAGFHEEIRAACAARLAEGPTRLCDLIDALKAHESGSVRLVALSSNATMRVSQILGTDPEGRFRQLREIVAPSKRRWDLAESRK